MKIIQIVNVRSRPTTGDVKVCLVDIPEGNQREVFEKAYPGGVSGPIKTCKLDLTPAKKYMMPLYLQDDIPAEDLVLVIQSLYINIDGKKLQGHAAKVVDLVAYEIANNSSLEDEKIIATGEKFDNGTPGSSSVAYRRVHDGKKKLELCLYNETPFFAGYCALIVFLELAPQ